MKNDQWFEALDVYNTKQEAIDASWSQFEYSHRTNAWSDVP